MPNNSRLICHQFAEATGEGGHNEKIGNHGSKGWKIFLLKDGVVMKRAPRQITPTKSVGAPLLTNILLYIFICILAFANREYVNHQNTKHRSKRFWANNQLSLCELCLLLRRTQTHRLQIWENICIPNKTQNQKNNFAEFQYPKKQQNVPSSLMFVCASLFLRLTFSQIGHKTNIE